MNEKKLLCNLIEIDSQVNHSNKRIIAYLEKMLSKYETKVIPVDAEDKELFNLIVKIPGKKTGMPLVFAMHTDTVPASQKWTKIPLKSLEEDGKIFGLGSCDMKAGIASVISAILELKNVPEKEIYLVFTADEEGSALGIKEAVQHLDFNSANIIIPEPTDRKLKTEHMGCLELEIIFHGKAIHSARTSYGNNIKNNAIYKCYFLLKELISLEQNISDGSIQNIGVIQGGASPNVVADRCSIKISRRFDHNQKPEKILKELNDIVRNIDQNAEIKILFEGEPFFIDKNSEFVEQIFSLIKTKFPDTEIIKGLGWTEAPFYKKFGDAIILGPGSGDQAHKPDEFVNIEDLTIFKNIYKEIINKK